MRNRVKRHTPPRADMPARLAHERDEIRETLGSSWWKAILFAAGNSLFDYLALLAALTAVGSRPRPTLVLLAYVAAMVLGMIPITPGGLGFVEAGLTATLTLAGVSAVDAVLATLAYRLVSYWLPLLLGPFAYLVHRRRYAGRSKPRSPPRRASGQEHQAAPGGPPRAHRPIPRVRASATPRRRRRDRRSGTSVMPTAAAPRSSPYAPSPQYRHEAGSTPSPSVA